MSNKNRGLAPLTHQNGSAFYTRNAPRRATEFILDLPERKSTRWGSQRQLKMRACLPLSGSVCICLSLSLSVQRVLAIPPFTHFFSTCIPPSRYVNMHGRWKVFAVGVAQQLDLCKIQEANIAFKTLLRRFQSASKAFKSRLGNVLKTFKKRFKNVLKMFKKRLKNV